MLYLKNPKRRKFGPGSPCAWGAVQVFALVFTVMTAAPALAANDDAAAADPPAEADSKPVVVLGEATTYRAEASAVASLPAHAQRVRVWFPLPRVTELQAVSDLDVELALERRTEDGDVDSDASGEDVVADSEASKDAAEDRRALEYREISDDFGNRIGFAEFSPRGPSDLHLNQQFKVERQLKRVDLEAGRTRPLLESERETHRRALEPTTYEMITPYLGDLAAEITEGDDNPATVLERLFGWMVSNTEIWLRAPQRLQPSGVGNAIYAASTRGGDCRDLGALFVSLARASGLPSRSVSGVLLDEGKGDGQKFRDGSDHCWVEVWLPSYDWVAVDLVQADLYDTPLVVDASNRDEIAALTVTDYSGADPAKRAASLSALDNRRMDWSAGREPVLDPSPASGRPDGIRGIVVEVDGNLRETVALGLRFKDGAGRAKEPKPAED